MPNETTRRTFIKSTAAAGAAMPLVMPPLARAQSPNNKLNVAFIGTGGRGNAHVGEINRMGENCPAYCDVDTSRQGRAAKNWPNAKAYQDYRRMLDREQKNIDAVFVATPDHHHYPAAMQALQLDKAVYCEKPLTWGVWEAHQLAKEAQKRKLPTQMGNQGHAKQGWRVVVAWINEGAIGDVKEVHTWTNRPVWPQGPKAAKRAASKQGSPDPVPDSLDWNTWIGPAPMRPFVKGVYHPFKWRGWYDFGSGALGDMACHTMDGTFWALNPGDPTSVEPVEVTGHTDDAFPNTTVVKWNFPERNGRPAFAQYWYSGGRKPRRPYVIDQDEWDKIGSGNLFIGTKGILRVWGDYGDSPRLVPHALLEQVGKPKNMLPPSPGHHAEFVMAAKGAKPWDFPKSNFSYAGPMSATIQLGNVALKAGERIEWDAKKMEVTNLPEANRYIRREPREGWAGTNAG